MRRIHWLGVALLVFGLVGCVPEPSSSTTSSSSIVSSLPNYYDPDNFVEGTKEVTETKLVTYDGPSIMDSSEVCSVKVNGIDLFVYDTLVNHERVWSWTAPTTTSQVVSFDFEGKVKMEVTINGVDSVEEALLRPLAYGTEVDIDGNKLTFDIEYQGSYVLEWNGDYKNCLQIFANSLEEDLITEEEAALDSSITYIGPGVYDADAIPIKENGTVYLAGGSYVYGSIRAEGLSNLTIRGRGIISGSIYTRNGDADYTIPLVLRSCNDILIEGLTFLDPAGWALNLYNCEDLIVKDVKIITARSNGDGISIQSCRNVEVSGGYVRTWDDSLVVKNVDRYVTSNVKFHDIVVWTDLAQSMEVGYETYGATMDGISFKNITVVHAFHKALISCHNSDDAEITNLSYENITLEDGRMLGDDREDGENDFLIDFTIAYNENWTESQGARGSIKNVNIENVKVYELDDTIVSRMVGEGEQSKIDGVTIKGISIEGRQITKLEELEIAQNQYAQNLSYETVDKVKGAIITLPYRLALTSETAFDHREVSSPQQEGILVPSFAILKGEAPFIGTKASGTFTSAATHSKGTSNRDPHDDGSGPFELAGHEGSLASDGNDETTFKSGEWKNEDNEFAALTISFDAAKYVGTIRLKGDLLNDYSYVYTFSIFGMKDVDGEPSGKYQRILSSRDYALTPSNGNMVDINVAAIDYHAIQFRFYRTSNVFAPRNYVVSEVEFYAPSLSYGKPIVEGTPHNDVYNIERVVDGDPTGTSYYESNALPAIIVIDLKDVYKVSDIVLTLPPSLQWNARTEEIEISGSADNLSYSSATSFEQLVAKKGYLFDPQTGNRNLIHFETPVSMRFLKLTIYSNDINGGYKAQLSEISVYGEK